MTRISKIIIIISVLLFIAAAIAAVYIMKNNIGIVSAAGAGSGQYYFTDLPNWKTYFLNDNYTSPVGIPVLTVLFIIWGVIMFKLWIWLDKRL